MPLHVSHAVSSCSAVLNLKPNLTACRWPRLQKSCQSSSHIPGLPLSRSAGRYVALSDVLILSCGLHSARQLLLQLSQKVAARKKVQNQDSLRVESRQVSCFCCS